jgi:hypothetical protein
MTKGKKNVKANKAATGGLHLFMHRTRGGNVVSCSLAVPRADEVTEFNAEWERTASEADWSEQERWLASVVQTASTIAGRSLNLRFEDKRGVRIEIPAEETEAA